MTWRNRHHEQRMRDLAGTPTRRLPTFPSPSCRKSHCDFPGAHWRAVSAVSLNLWAGSSCPASCCRRLCRWQRQQLRMRPARLGSQDLLLSASWAPPQRSSSYVCMFSCISYSSSHNHTVTQQHSHTFPPLLIDSCCSPHHCRPQAAGCAHARRQAGRPPAHRSQPVSGTTNRHGHSGHRPMGAAAAAATAAAEEWWRFKLGRPNRHSSRPSRPSRPSSPSVHWSQLQCLRRRFCRSRGDSRWHYRVGSLRCSR